MKDLKYTITFWERERYIFFIMILYIEYIMTFFHYIHLFYFLCKIFGFFSQINYFLSNFSVRDSVQRLRFVGKGRDRRENIQK